MNKLFPLILIPMLMVACGDDKSSSANDDEFSSSEESSVSSSSEENNEPTSSSNISDDNWITTVDVDNFSFFDEKYLRYYFLEEECDYDTTTNSFKWYTEDYTGVYKYDELVLEAGYNNDSLKYMIFNSFGYKMSNDTLYECDYIGDACDTIKAATLYIGSSKSIFSTWECVGRIYQGEFTEIPSNYKITLELTPKQKTITTRTKITGSSYTPEPVQYCSVIYNLFNDGQKEELCNDYLRNIKKLSADTTFIDSDMWIVAKDHNKADLSINNKILEISMEHTLEMNPSQISTFTTKITYQESTCTLWQKNIELTQEYCENGDHSQDDVGSDYSNIHRDFVKQLYGSSSNNEEFEECLKQFNLK